MLLSAVRIPLAAVVVSASPAADILSCGTGSHEYPAVRSMLHSSPRPANKTDTPCGHSCPMAARTRASWPLARGRGRTHQPVPKGGSAHTERDNMQPSIPRSHLT